MPLDLTHDLVQAFGGPATAEVQYGPDQVGGILNDEDLEIPDGTGADRVVAAGTVLWIQRGSLPALESALATGQEPEVRVDGVLFRARSSRRQGSGAYLQIFLVSNDAGG